MTSPRTYLALFALMLLSIGGLPAEAGTVYIPVASNEIFAGNAYRTQLWISNPTNRPLQFTTVFIPSTSDGTVTDRNTLQPVTVLPGSTFFVQNVAPAGSQGMMELNADDELLFSAKLITEDLTLNEATEVAGARLPLISSENVIPADQVAQLLALERSRGEQVSNVGVINLSPEPATCTARVFGATGEAIGGTATFPLPPVSHVQFDQALALLGLEDAQGVRAVLSCDQPFYAFATIFGVEAPFETLFVPPATRGDSELRAPGLIPPFVEFTRIGDFLAATEADPYVFFQLPVERGVAYSRIEIDFDFFLGRFNTDLFHTVFSLRSGGLFAEMALRGDNARTFWDTPGESARGTGPWRPGGQYHVHAVYDVVENQAVLEISEFGQVVQRLEVRANRNRLGAVGGALSLDFSQRKVFDNAFFPLWGSVFSNLEVKIFEE